MKKEQEAAVIWILCEYYRMFEKITEDMPNTPLYEASDVEDDLKLLGVEY